MSLPLSSSLPLASLLFIAIAPLQFTAEAANVVSNIDHFLDATNPSSTGPQVWNRGIDLNVTANPLNQVATAQVNPVADGFFVLDIGPQAVATVELNYATIIGATDLTAGGVNGIVVGLLFADIPGDYTTTVTDNLGNIAFGNVTTTGAIQELTDLEFEFASFNGFNNVDFTNVTNIDVAYAPSSDNADLVIDYVSLGQITAVPEPNSTALVLITSALLVTTRRRRRS